VSLVFRPPEYLSLKKKKKLAVSQDGVLLLLSKIRRVTEYLSSLGLAFHIGAVIVPPNPCNRFMACWRCGIFSQPEFPVCHRILLSCNSVFSFSLPREPGIGFSPQVFYMSCNFLHDSWCSSSFSLQNIVSPVLNEWSYLWS
jgi:hypothetical protein